VNQWFHVQQISKGPDGTVVPEVPTFVWLNTAYYARQRAEMYYGLPGMDMIVVLVKPGYVFPANAVELVEMPAPGVQAVPLTNPRDRK
jgi:hypothetical protein